MYGDTLYFYEEILLLALKDKAGVTSVAFLEQSIALRNQRIEACEAAAAISVIMSTVIIPTVVS